RTSPAIIAPVSSPTNAQNTGDSEPNTTAASDCPDTFQAASYTSRSKLPQPNTSTRATGASPNTTHSDWNFATGFGPSRLIANISQISAIWPATCTCGLPPSSGSSITR